MRTKPPLSRKARKALANAYMKLFGDTRAAANQLSTIHTDYYLALWNKKKSHKNPRRRSASGLDLALLKRRIFSFCEIIAVDRFIPKKQNSLTGDT